MTAIADTPTMQDGTRMIMSKSHDPPPSPDAELVVAYMVKYDLEPEDDIGDLLHAIRREHRDGRSIQKGQDLQDPEGNREALPTDRV
jgi:hypothetical protein